MGGVVLDIALRQVNTGAARGVVAIPPLCPCATHEPVRGDVSNAIVIETEAVRLSQFIFT